MLQYLLNASAIWLISLVSYDIFLRRESYHSYNRFYLLSTFLLGALLPIWQWQDSAIITKGSFHVPIEKVMAAKQTAIAASTPTGNFDWTFWLGVIYAAGMLAAIVLLCIDITKMTVFYHNGRKSKQDGWTVIETGREHAPFSFGNILFVRTRQQYSADDWSIVSVHERRHKTLLHIADLLLMQVGRIIFWFHPLAYIYNKPLLLVHEYQADSIASDQPKQYGSFLIEQSLLSPAPNFSHSFNRSPIKKRILMLTRRSNFAAKSKMLVYLPLVLVCVFCFSKNIFSQKPIKQGNLLKYNGNTIEFAPPKPTTRDTCTDPKTGAIISINTHNWADPPIKLNGNDIYESVGDNEISKPKIKSNDKSLADYLIRNLNSEFEQLADGKYNMIIGNVVINSQGKVVYYENKGIQKLGSDVDDAATNKKPIINKIEALLNDKNLEFSPAIYRGKPVDYLITNTIGYRNGESIVVKKHKMHWDSIEEQ